MPFARIDIDKEIEKIIGDDQELRTYYKEACEEYEQQYELIKQLTKIRKEKGLTQETVSKLAGMSQQAVSRIESMGHAPSLPTFLKYVRALGCRIRIEPEPLCEK